MCKFRPSKIGIVLAAIAIAFLGGALIYPLFAKSHPNYGSAHGGLAHLLRERHLRDGSWPQTGDKVWTNAAYSFRLKRALPTSAIYQISVDGQAQTWWVTEKGQGRMPAK